MAGTIRPIESNEELVDAIKNRKAFRTHPATGQNNTIYEDGIFHGHTYPLSDPMADSWTEDQIKEFGTTILFQIGSLTNDPSGNWHDQFKRDFEFGLVDYFVYSYDTIIGWHVGALNVDMYQVAKAAGITTGWTVTGSILSATTSQHQARLILLLQELGEPVR